MKGSFLEFQKPVHKNTMEISDSVETLAQFQQPNPSPILGSPGWLWSPPGTFRGYPEPDLTSLSHLKGPPPTSVLPATWTGLLGLQQMTRGSVLGNGHQN